MIFTSFEFVVFLFIVFLLYFSCATKHQWIVLLISSMIFYCFAGIKFIPFIMTTIVASYLAALFISSRSYKLSDNDGIEISENNKKYCRRCLCFFLMIVLGILCYTKFTNIVLLTMLNLCTFNLDNINLIVPLGISYYTFSTIGYVLDVYWKRYKAEKNIFKYMLYVMYFPHILQGPIARYNRLAPQLFEEHYFEYKRICFGIQLMLWGFFQKLVIADRLAIFVSSVYGSWKAQEGFILLVATVFASFQVYMDFSGCMNIAQGVSQIFDIKLENNFRQPYFAQSVSEFWRRWHITLGEWFKDYLCMPIAVSNFVKTLSKRIKSRRGISAGKKVVTILPLVAVWTATGLWHGSGLNYVVWGIWHGSIIIFSTLMEKNYFVWKKQAGIDDKSSDWKIFRIARTFLLTAIIPRVITQTKTLESAMGIFKNMISKFNIWIFLDGTLYRYGLDAKDFGIIALSLMFVLVVSLLKERNVYIREAIAKKHIVLRWTIYYMLFFSVIIFGVYGSAYGQKGFIYMMF